MLFALGIFLVGSRHEAFARHVLLNTEFANLDGARRAMRASYQREMDALEARLAFLASAGSVSPYVGLFGTVWGIMHAFTGLSGLQQATLASVAPGIAESLIATAIGLFAAAVGLLHGEGGFRRWAVLALTVPAGP